MSYKILKDKVIHSCAICGVELENRVSEAGQNDVCPKCGSTFAVPGERELKRLRAAEEELQRMGARKEAADRTAEGERLKRQEEARQKAAERHANVAVAKEVWLAAPSAPVPRETTSVVVPNYSGLSLVGWVLIVFGILDAVLAVVILVLVVVAIVGSAAATNDRREMAGMGVFFASAGFLPLLTSLVSAVFLIGAGNAVHALRDMAMNSFHLRNAVGQMQRLQD